MLQVPEHIDVLIVRCMEGVADAREQQMLEQWLAESPEHRRYMTEMENLYFGIPANKSEMNIDRAWQKVNERTTARTIDLRQRRVWTFAAAAIAIGIALFVGYRWNESRTAIEQSYAAMSEPTEAHLPDSTHVQLNRGSEVRFVQLNNGVRTAYLKGEAYFEIHAPSKDHPGTFAVETDGMRIEDIGTAFNVKALPNNDTITVTVTDGIVMVFVPGESHTIEKGNTGIWNKRTKRFELLSAPEEQNGAAWANKSLKFRNTRIDKVLKKVSEAYGVSIITSDPDMLSCRLTAAFDGEPLEAVMAIVCDAMNWTMESTPQGVVLNGEGCKDDF